MGLPRVSPPGLTQTAHILAVCGMPVEERIVVGARVKAICGSGGPDLLQRLTSALTDRAQVAAIVSFGIAGGLDPDLRPGTPILAPWVIGRRGRWNADTGWLQALSELCGNAVCAGIAGSDLPVGTPGDKKLLRESTDAAAVDMESHIVAEIAAQHGLPFAAIRVVADSADRHLPEAAMIPLRKNGRPDIVAVLGSLAIRPGQLPTLVGVARDVRHALRSLGRIRQDIGGTLACPYIL